MANFRDVLREAANAAGLEITGGDVVITAPATEVDNLGNLSIVWERDRIQVQVNAIEQNRRSLECYLSVREIDGKMIKAPLRINLLSNSSVTALVRTLVDRRPLDWASRIDQVVMIVHRTMLASREVSVLKRRTADIEQDWLVQPLLERNQHSMLVAEGGSGKSLFTLAVIASLVTDTPLVPSLSYHWDRGRVLYLDWETDRATHERRLTQLLPEDAEWPEVHYIRMSSPITDDVQYLSDYVQTHDINLVAIDSIGMACGGDMNTQTDAIAYINACRALGEVTVLSITHPGWASNSRSTGSRYFENASRACWRIEKQQEEGTGVSHLDVINYKSNNGMVHKPFGLDVTFSERITYTSSEVSMARQPVAEQVRQVMDIGTPIKVNTIFEDLPDTNQASIRQALARMVSDGTAERTGRGEYRLKQIEFVTENTVSQNVTNRGYDTGLSLKGERPTNVSSDSPPTYDKKKQESHWWIDDDDPLPEF